MAFKIPHMYWSTSSPSNNAVLLQREQVQVVKHREMLTQHKVFLRLRTHLHTGHRHVPRSQFSCKYDSKSKH